MNKWHEKIKADMGLDDQHFQEGLFYDNRVQNRIIISILAFWVGLYMYTDHIILGWQPVFVVMASLRILFIAFSVLTIFVIQKTKSIALGQHFIFFWTLLLVIITVLSALFTPQGVAYKIFSHSLLILGIYLLIPNRFWNKIMLATLLTMADLGLLFWGAFGPSKQEVLSSLFALLGINGIGLALTIERELQRYKQHRFQQNLINGRVHLKQLATTDSLTGILNRRSFLEMAEIELDRFQRYRKTFSLSIIDIDQFKLVNDTFGHPIGDLVLQYFTEIIWKNKRGSDIFGRLAGDEFALIMPNTSITDARGTMARILAVLTANPMSLADGRVIHIQFSYGVAEVQVSDHTFDQFYRRVDYLLYQSKQNINSAPPETE